MDTSWNIRKTEDRVSLMEQLRKKLKKNGRDVQKVNGAVTTAAIFDEALKALERELDGDHE